MSLSKVNNKARNIEKISEKFINSLLRPGGPILKFDNILWPWGHGGHPDMKVFVIIQNFGFDQYDSLKNLDWTSKKSCVSK